MSEEGIFKGKRMHMWCCAGGTVVYYTSEIQHSFPFLAGCVSFGQKGGEGFHIFTSLAHFCARVLQLIGSFSSFLFFILAFFVGGWRLRLPSTSLFTPNPFFTWSLIRRHLSYFLFCLNLLHFISVTYSIYRFFFCFSLSVSLDNSSPFFACFCIN